MNPADPSPASAPPRFDLAVTCLDKRCPQKISCARWLDARRSPSTPQLPGRVITLPTLRGPHECRCRPCRAWLPVTPAREASHG